jgi:hypothetical protein
MKIEFDQLRSHLDGLISAVDVTVVGNGGFGPAQAPNGWQPIQTNRTSASGWETFSINYQ